MAEDPRHLLHFKTLAKFNEKVADGTVSTDRHIAYIKDEQLLWCRGQYYGDYKKLNNIISLYNSWSITQNNANNLTITLTGKQWDESTRTWSDISNALNINAATQSVAGLMTAADKASLDSVQDKINSDVVTVSDTQTITGAKTFTNTITGSITGNAGSVDGYSISKVSSLPASPDANTIYFVV